MNFIDFLKNNSVVSFNTQNSSDQQQPINADKSININKDTNKDTNKNTNKNTNKDTNKDTNKNTNKDTNKEEQRDYSAEQNLYSFKKGDFVKIVKYKDSIYNYYKSYIGEIKEYNPYQNYVTVFLHSISHIKLIQMHPDHVVKI